MMKSQAGKLSAEDMANLAAIMLCVDLCYASIK